MGCCATKSLNNGVPPKCTEPRSRRTWTVTCEAARGPSEKPFDFRALRPGQEDCRSPASFLTGGSAVIPQKEGAA